MADADKPQIIILEPCTKTVEDLLRMIEEKNQAELIRVNSADEAQQLARHHQPCMLIACIQENSEIPNRVNMLKRLEGSIKKGLIKSLFVSKIKNRQINTLVTSLGVTDFMEEPVAVRTLQFKANLQLKAVQTIRKQQAMKLASEEKIVFKKSAQKNEAGATGATESPAKSAPALSLAEDTFLFKNSGHKKVGKKTILEVEGPSPETGDWVPHEDKGNAQTNWRWVPKNEAAAAETKDGWVHEGDRPQFQEASGKWQLASEKPDLSFQKNGKKIAQKISVDENGELVVADDSIVATENLKKSRQTAAAESAKEASEKIVKDLQGEKNNPTLKDPKVIADQNAISQKNSIINSATEEKEQAGDEIDQNKNKENLIEKKVFEKANQKSDAEEQKINKKETEEKDNKKKKAISPLDFLARKKMMLEKSQQITLSNGDNDSENNGEDPVRRLTSTNEEGKKPVEGEKSKDSPEGFAKKIKKTPADAARAALDRMKKRVGEESSNLSGEDSLVESGEENEESEENEQNKELEDLDKILAPGSEKKLAGKSPALVPTKKTKNEREAAPLPEVKQARKKKIYKEIQEILAQPLPDSLPKEMEKAIRKELGLENQPEVNAKELAKKKRIRDIKKLKDELGDLSLEDESLPSPKGINQHDLKEENPENTWSEKGELSQGSRTKIRAFDSDAVEVPEEESSSISKIHRKDPSRSKELEDKYLYLPEASLQPLGAAWESAADYYVFLAAEIRYRGFKKIEDILPLWIYSGKKVPELLDKTKQWRFLSSLPVEARTTSDIPREVRDFLIELRDQLLKTPKEVKEAERPPLPDLGEGVSIEDESEKIDSKKEADSSVDNSDNGLSEDSTASIEADTRSRKNAEDPLSVEQSIDEASPTEPDEFRNAKKDKKTAKRDISQLLASLEAEEKALESRDHATTLEAEEEVQESRSQATTLEAEEEAQESRSQATTLEAEEEAQESRSQATTLEEIFEKKQQEAAGTSNDFSPEKPRPQNSDSLSLAEKIAKNLESESPAMQSFLERRKRKKETLPTLANALKLHEPVTLGTSHFLGMLVALSNSFGPQKDKQKALSNVLRSIEMSFGNCAVFILSQLDSSGNATVHLGSGAGLEPGIQVSLNSGLAREIRNESGEYGKILGYLFLRPMGVRTSFSIEEEAACTKAAALLIAVIPMDMLGETERKAA